jgi:tetratricopeptide (TPR) repeat protein
VIHLRFGDNFKAALQFRHSFLLLKENKKKFPDFRYNDFFFGLETAAVGAIPEDYKWIASLLGLKGDVKNGIAMMGNFAERHAANDIFQPEDVVFYNFMKYYLLYKQDEVWEYLRSEKFVTKNNLMYSFLKGDMALNYRKADISIAVFKDATTISDYNKYPLFEYQLGYALFLKLDPTCIDHFKSFLNKYHGKLYVKDALYKMALFYYLERNLQQANYYKDQITKQGNTLVDADKTALRFAERQNWPNPILLRAHLQIDGGYYKQAFDILNAMNEQELTTLTDKLEYTFRLARVYDEMGDREKAIAYYQKTINAGRDESDYFAARAALQMAFIYEKAGDTKNAIVRYNECLGMRHHDFQNAIDQQAKAGVNRLTVK